MRAQNTKPPSSSATRKPLKYSREKKLLSGGNEHRLFVEMTDIFKTLKVDTRGKKICLQTKVENDGIGDLIHQIRAAKVLRQTFKDQIVCSTYTHSRFFSWSNAYSYTFEDKIEKLIREHQFETHFNEYNYEIFHEKFDLVVTVSLAGGIEDDIDISSRSYSLEEIRDRLTGSGYNYSEPAQRIKEDIMGFLPTFQGIWIDEIPLAKAKNSMILHASPALKKALHCSELSTREEATQWLNHSWIAQSQSYYKNNFIITLFAQLKYIQKSELPINNVIIKYAGYTREDHEWKLKEKLREYAYNEALSLLNVKELILDGVTYAVNNNKTITLNLFKKRLETADYATFQQLTNGIIFPAGDNTYSEAYSNPNTLLPPFPELRDYKYNTLSPLFSLIKTLSLDGIEKNWLRHVFQGSRILLEDNRLPLYKLFEKAETLAERWAQSSQPHKTWLTLHNELKKHDLAQRLPAIIKEQLIFKEHPHLEKEKLRLIEESQRNAVSKYKALVEAACRSSRPQLK